MSRGRKEREGREGERSRNEAEAVEEAGKRGREPVLRGLGASSARTKTGLRIRSLPPDAIRRACQESSSRGSWAGQIEIDSAGRQLRGDLSWK